MIFAASLNDSGPSRPSSCFGVVGVDGPVAPAMPGAAAPNSLSIFLPCVPPTVTSQQKGAFALKGARGVRFYKKPRVIAAENLLSMLLAPHRPHHPFLGPVALCVTFIWPFRAGEPRKVRDQVRVPMWVRPDCSNVIKLLEDVMTKAGFWKDDAQVCDLTVSKRWGRPHGIAISITTVETVHQISHHE